MRLIGANLLTAYREPENKEARMNMLAGSYEAGIAFTNAYVGYVHAIAHGIGGLYHVPAGGECDSAAEGACGIQECRMSRWPGWSRKCAQPRVSQAGSAHVRSRAGAGSARSLG